MKIVALDVGDLRPRRLNQVDAGRSVPYSDVIDGQIWRAVDFDVYDVSFALWLGACRRIRIDNLRVLVLPLRPAP